MNAHAVPLAINLITIVTITAILVKAISFPEKSRVHHAFLATLVTALITNFGTLFTYLYFLDRIERAVLVYFFGICLLPPSLFLVAFYYLNPDRRFRKLHLLPFLIPAISIVIAATNEVHHLLIRTFSFYMDELVYGPWFAVHAAYSFTLSFIAIGMFVVFAFKSKKSSAKRAWLIVVGSLVPVIQYAIVTLQIVHTSLLNNSMGFSFAVISYWFAIVRLDFLNFIPFAYREIVDHVSDGVLVIEKDRKILLVNRAFFAIFRGVYHSESLLTGTKVCDFFEKTGFQCEAISEQIELARASRNTVAVERSVTLLDRERHFEIECTPVSRKGGIVGMIILFRDITVHKRNLIDLKNQKRTVEDLNTRLKSLAELDALTGAFNRRFFDEYFAIEATRSLNRLRYRPAEGPGTVNFGIAIIDIDDFKRVNDTYGHQAGDEVLRQMVTVMRNTVFERDVICRYGGEEFVVLFTNADGIGIAKTAEKIRDAIATERFSLGEGYEPIRITVSVGLATFEELYEKTGDGANCIRVADERLYKAKRSGKNKVCLE